MLKVEKEKDDCVIAAHTVTLTAMTMGLETCYIGLLEKAATGSPMVLDAMELPRDNKVYSVLIAGYPEYEFKAIWIKDRNITRLAPKDRNLSFIFQDIILFPHLNVRRNISFGLDMRKSCDKAEIDRRVQEAARLTQLSDLLDRKSHELSGGQAQRVALARAIVMEADAFLMDEPLANLDAKLRVEMRTQIKRIQRKLATAAIFVTHDQEEALSLGDTIAVMNGGLVQQIGTPHEIYHDPVNLFVGTFIGSPQLNLFRCSVHSNGSGIRVKSELFDLQLPDSIISKLSGQEAEVTMGIRPEFVRLGCGPRNSFPAKVGLIEPLGSRTLVFLETETGEIRCAIQGVTNCKEREILQAGFDLEKALFFNDQGIRL